MGEQDRPSWHPKLPHEGGYMVNVLYYGLLARAHYDNTGVLDDVEILPDYYWIPDPTLLKEIGFDEPAPEVPSTTQASE